MNLSSMFSKFKSALYKNYGEDAGKLLVHTGTLGWILSALAQVSAVIFNDKISPDQKSFLIPQEIADACVNIASFYLVTNSIKGIGAKLVKTGKLRTPHIEKFLKKYNLFKKLPNGKLASDFNLNIKAHPHFNEISKDYNAFNNGIGIVTGTIGSVFSSNIITPIIRNDIAAHQQKQILAHKNKINQPQLKAPKGITIQQYQNMVSRQYSQDLKV